MFDYIDGGADDERSLANNAAGFERLEFRPNVLRDVSELDTHTTLLGKRISMPLVLAPTGYTRLTHSQGELSAARSAARADVPYSLSTMSTRSIEEVGGGVRTARSGSRSTPGKIADSSRNWSSGLPPPGTRRCGSPSTRPCWVAANATCDEA